MTLVIVPQHVCEVRGQLVEVGSLLSWGPTQVVRFGDWNLFYSS